MKRCPKCNRVYSDETLRFCLEDGAPLVDEAIQAPTVQYSQPGSHPPQPTMVSSMPPAPWSGAQPQAKKRSAWPWILGSIAAVCVLGIGLIVLVFALAGLSNDNQNNNTSRSDPPANQSTTNANDNSNTTETTNTSSDTESDAAAVNITDINMAKDDDGKPGESSGEFAPDDHTIYCVVKLSEAKANTVVRFVWSQADVPGSKNEQITTVDYTTKDRENKVHAHVTSPYDWAKGMYKVEVYINGTLDETIFYLIAV